MNRLATICLCVIAAESLAATYYIDYDGGSDGNAGTSTGAAWQRCPGMNGFAGSYSHSSGDRFIFKGGVTWSNAVFGLEIDNSGAAGNEDYYGVDESWYAGGAWSHPIFDLEGTDPPNGNDRECAVIVRGDNVIVDRIWVTDLLIPDTDFMRNKSFLAYQSSNVTFTGCVASNWIVETSSGGDFGGFGDYQGVNTIATNCIASGPLSIATNYVSNAGWATNDYRSSGDGFESLDLVINCISEHTSQGVWNCGSVQGTTVRNGGYDFTSVTHENAINAYGSVAMNVSGNLIYNWGDGTAIYLVPGWADADGVILCYNNIIYDVGPTPISLSESGISGATATEVHIYNNIAVSSGTCLTESDRANPSISVVRIQNNLWITDASPIFIEPTNPDELISNNATMTVAQATSANLTAGNLYEPQGEVAALYDTGLTLSSYFSTDYSGVYRPSGPVWDIGAFEFDQSDLWPYQPENPPGRLWIGVP